MRLIYFSYGSVSVFDSQVLALLQYYCDTNYFEEVNLVVGVKSGSEKKKGSLKTFGEKINIGYYRHFPQYPLISKLTEKSLAGSLNRILDPQDCLIHVRNEVLGSYVANVLLKKKFNLKNLIIDIRGAGFEQLVEYSNLPKWQHVLKKKHREKVYGSLNKIENISVVSDSLKTYVEEKSIDRRKIDVVHSFASADFRYDREERRRIRSELNIDTKEIVVIFIAGGRQPWQKNEVILNRFLNIGCRIINLSKKKIDHANVINRYVPYKEVPKFLCGADIGIIWRDKNVTNKVASPVKFSEYLCCGLPVIANDSVDLITDVVHKYSCGKIVKDVNDINEEVVNFLLNLDRSRISEAGEKIFGLKNISSKYLQIYKKMQKE